MSHTPGPLPDPDDKELESIAERHGVRWGGNFWIIEDADLHPFMRSMLAHTAAEVARAVAAERERWLRVAEAAQAVTVGCEDQGEDFLLPSHLMSSLALALDESPLAAIRADPQRLQDTGE